MKKHFFWLRYHDPRLSNAPAIEKRIEVDPRKTLRVLFRELGLAGLWGKGSVRRLFDNQKIRSFYIPQSGDVLQAP